LTDAAFDGKQHLAQLLGICTDSLRLGEDAAGLARGVEHPFINGQHHCADSLGAGMGAQQGLSLEVTDLDAALEHAHQNQTADGR
jgi:hypothetical protein